MAKSKHLLIGGPRDGQVREIEDALVILQVIMPRVGPSGLEYDVYVRHDFGSETVFAIEGMTAADVAAAILSVA